VRSISSVPLLIVALLLTGQSDLALAEVSVQGPAEDVRLEAQDASVNEILEALRKRFVLRFSGMSAIRHVTVKYSGPLRRILARVLEGYDYVIKPNGAKIDVIVLSTGAPRQAAPAPGAAIFWPH
jgi:hypothetical protein